MPKIRQSQELSTVVLKLVEEHRLTELQQLIVSSDLPVPEPAVRTGYRLYVDQEMAFRTKFFLISKLYEITKITPDDSIVTSLLRIIIGKQPLPILKLVCDKMNIKHTHLKAMSKEIQDWYRNLMDTNLFMQVSQLKELCGLDPDPAMIQEIYKSYLISGRLISYAGLSKQLTVLPQPDTIQYVYAHFRQALSAGSKMSGTDRENVQKWYAKIEPMTGIADINPKSLQE